MKTLKTIINLKLLGKFNRWAGLLGGIMAAFCCSIGHSQIIFSNAPQLIYSNSFSGSAAVSVNGTAPTVANTLLGGSSSANWIVTFTNAVSVTNSTLAGTILENGTIGTNGGAALLPFTPQGGAIYYMTASVTLPSPMGNWISMGFTKGAPQTNNPGWARFTDAGNEPVSGYAWMDPHLGASANFFVGPGTSGGGGSSSLTPSAGTYTLEIILNTFGTNWGVNSHTNWMASAYVNSMIMGTNVIGGAQLGTTIVYGANPPIGFAGIGQNSFNTGNLTGLNWNYWTLSTPLSPQISVEPVSAGANQGSAFTNTVSSIADTNGGALFYQWYTNGVPVAGATSGTLVFNPVSVADASTNIYVVITNNYGAITSSIVSLAVYTSPVFASLNPITFPSSMLTLYGGTNSDGTNYFGSTPTFSAFATGKTPLTYQWLTNGVAVGGATGTSFTFTNCQWDSPTNFTCVAMNSLGQTSNTWGVVYLPAPTAPFPQAVLAGGAVAYWRLNEADDGSGYNNGDVCHDYASGNNGIYTNTQLGLSPGYSYLTDPTETAALFGGDSKTSCDANSMGTNIDFSGESNAEFTVSVWANGSGISQTANSGMVTKGYFNGEEFTLDNYGSPSHVRLSLRNAAGTQCNALSSFSLSADRNWHYIAGVCDESNGVIYLYVDGALAAQGAITPGSGVFNDASVPIMIGARSSTATSYGDNQFQGYLNDAAVYNYALSQAQIAGQYQAAGGTISPSFIPPLPPTNVVYQANGTLTIPATAIGEPPVGYYWTNLMTGEVLDSGTVSVLENLDATLTIPNAPASLSGDRLELIVTNSSASTNWFVTLFSPPPPVTLDYTDPILYSNDFNGGTWAIGGMPLTAANSLVGGTNATWTDALGTNDTESMLANGIDSTSQDSWLLPLTPEPGYVYTLTASLTFSGAPGNWVGLGYAQRIPTNAAAGYGVFDDGGSTPPDEGPNGYDWIILTEGSGNVQYFAGPTTENSITNSNAFFTPGPGTHTVQVVLATTNAQWSIAAYVDGIQAGTNYPYAVNPPIGAIGITQNGLTAPDNVQWNYFSLSQVAPGGVPPYLLSPLPPSSVLLTNATVTIPATVFGSAPLGYYWSFNNSTVLASGITNNLSPLSADLSVPSSSLGSGQLELTVTNAYGTNTTLVTLVSPVNSNPTNIVTTLTNNNLYLTWPQDHIGWQLQAQTNSLGVGISTNWANYNPSTGTNQVAIPINLTNGVVFYRLIYTP